MPIVTSLTLAAAIAALGGIALVARMTRARRPERAGEPLIDPVTERPTLIAFASQTGFAERLATQTARALQAAGMPVRVTSFAELDGTQLAACAQALFLVSTTGEGEAPDSASGFARRMVAGIAPDSLQQLRYGILALGDSNYAHFCGFAHTLSAWLQRQRAQPMFDMVTVDNGDPSAVRRWQDHLSALAGGADIPDWERPRYGRWQLAERRLLNPGSAGEPAFHLALVPEDGTAPGWSAGDIAEVGPCHPPEAVAPLLARLALDGSARVRCDSRPTTLAEALATRLPLPDSYLDTLVGLPPQRVVDALPALPHRAYTIASLPADGRLELLVRQQHHADGGLGLASGWLTARAALGTPVMLRLRANPAFHVPADDRPLILIGNGTGLAGLRALLKARAAAGHHRNWLLFGERAAAHDAFYRDDLAQWRAQGVLQRIDLVYSRDGGAQRYVQDAVTAHADALREWVAEGAAIYVCGSQQGMAGGVHAALRAIVDDAALQQMSAEGRYRRDVY